MREGFIGYYRPTKEEFEVLWRDGIIAFDANVLLNLYRYSAPVVKELVASLTRRKEQIWLSHQAGLEFHRNRLGVIRSQVAAYGDVQKVLQSAERDLSTILQQYRDHPLLKADELRKRLARGIKPLKKYLNELQERHPDYTAKDPILDIVTDLFAGRVGGPYDVARMKEIHADGAARFAAKRPPGYADSAKDGEEKQYGDLVMWFQMIDKAKADKTPLIFVTDDAKEDWWWIEGGKTQGPRPELIAEFQEKAGTAFYAYLPDRFLEREAGVAQSEPRKAAIAEVKQVREEKDRRNQIWQTIIDGETWKISLTKAKEVDDLRRQQELLTARRERILKRMTDLMEGPAQSAEVYAETSDLRDTLSKLDAEAQTIDRRLRDLREQDREFYKRILGRMRLISGLEPEGGTETGGTGPTGPAPE